MSGVSVVIVSYNTREMTLQCVRSVVAETGVARVVVVDNASADGSAAALRAEFGDVTVVENDTNLGFAGGVNCGWLEVTTEFGLLLNSDAMVAPGAISALRSFLRDHPRAAAVSATIFGADGHVQHSAQRRARPWRVLLEASRLHKLLPAGRRGRVLLGPYWSYDRDVEVDWTWGTALMLRARAMHEVGGLDEDYFMYGEDVEWCLRARDRGWEIWQTSSAVVRHVGGASAADDPSLDRRRIDGVFRALVLRTPPAGVRRLELALRCAAAVDSVVGRAGPDNSYARSREALERVRNA